MKLFETSTKSLLVQSLNVYDKQHRAIANNIAHANDDTFKRENTDFSSVLKSASDSRLKTSNARHIKPESKGEEFSHKNNKSEGKVDFTEEMGDLAVNQIRYDFSSRVLRRVYDGIGTAIRGRL